MLVKLETFCGLILALLWFSAEIVLKVAALKPSALGPGPLVKELAVIRNRGLDGVVVAGS